MLLIPKWNHPKIPIPPVPQQIILEKDNLRLISLRKKTGWGAKTIKSVFNFQYSESTIRRRIKKSGLSRGKVKSKICVFIG